MSQFERNLHDRIPISVSLNESETLPNTRPSRRTDKRRLAYTALLAVCIACVISFLAKLLVFLIDFITNLSFHRVFSLAPSSPATNTYGGWVILVPVIGGLLVGLMARYGSKAIRGHGIPEAMEQILTNKSKIHPAITYLKPLSAAISIGTGGPFGAEGPIIATGGALGSTIGQVLKISSYERKILLASGATAGMAAIFGTPIAAIFLAVELLLFEFSPRSILPVALACITGAAGHHLLFEAGPVFPSPGIAVPGNEALALYSCMGLITGVLAAGITKAVYLVEDAFEKLPVHWSLWPMIGGLAVGLFGYFVPRTLGVGYNNITDLLSGNLALNVVVSLCLLKFISWVIALGSGTSGGTLAPLLTIGGATGVLLGTAANLLFPAGGISLPLAAMVGMAAMFAGASRALLTSIVFALETSGQANALLPLLGACVGSYGISYLLMSNTIMTEKISRRGVMTPHVYEPDILNGFTVKQVLREEATVLGHDVTLSEVRQWLRKHKGQRQNAYIVADPDGGFKGIVSASEIFSVHHADDCRIDSLIHKQPFVISAEDSLRTAVEVMAGQNVDVLPVKAPDDQRIIGVLTHQDLLAVYRRHLDDHKENVTISLKRRTLKILLHGRRRLSIVRRIA